MYILINNNRGFKWIKYKNIYFKGYISNSSQDVFMKSIPNDLSNFIGNEIDFQNIIKKLNGAFSILVESANYIYACVDQIRSFPLFYYFENKKFLISDDIEYLKNLIKNIKVNRLAVKELDVTGYITDNDTIYEKIKKMEPYQYLIYNKKNQTLIVKNYGKFKHEGFLENNEVELLSKLDECYMHVFNKMIKNLHNRTVVVPLSGGYDSRCIVILLKRLGYENVICYSYGKEKNKESETSRKIAKELGYRWEFVEYSRKKWEKWYNCEQMNKYYKYAYNGSSIPIFQDWPAVMELQRKNLIHKDSIFIPGYSGDMVAGSHIPEMVLKVNKLSYSDIIKHILINNYCLYDINKVDDKILRYFANKINNSEKISDKQFYEIEEAADIIERWDYKNRQANFINNALRVYEFWGYEWRTPFWDKEILSFWEKISYKNRINRNLYFKYDNYLKYKYLPSFVEEEKNEYLKSIYYNHPLDWYGIIPFEKFIQKSDKLNYSNINSFIAEDFIKKFDENLRNDTVKEYYVQRAKIEIYYTNIKIRDSIDIIINEFKLKNLIDIQLLKTCVQDISFMRKMAKQINIDEDGLNNIYNLFNLLINNIKENKLKEVDNILIYIEKEQKVLLKCLEKN